MEGFNYHSHLRDIASKDVDEVIKKDHEYGASWKKRGGVGAYFVIVRKIDRLEEQVKKHVYNIFEAIRGDSREEGVIDDIRDLRRYLMLVEAEMMEQGVVPSLGRSVRHKRKERLRKKIKIKPTGMKRPFGYDEEEEEID